MSGALLQGDVLLPLEGILRVVQITDTHLMAERGSTLLAVDTDASLEAVVRLASTGPNADIALITGDIAGDGAASAYTRLEQALAPLNCPSFWLPGNHDDIEEPLQSRFVRRVRTPHWDIVNLNSQIPGQVGGRLEEAELRALNDAVDAAVAERKHLLVAMHHPLLPLGVAWLDPQRVANAEAVFQALDAPLHCAVICGHVHQESDQTYQGIRLLSTPSTCVQFAPGAEDFTADTIGPGYRWLQLYPDGRLETGVERVPYEAFPVDLACRGYE
jgi:Icc protein